MLVLHQKARNVFLTTHVLGLLTTPVAATYTLSLGLDCTPTLYVLLKYTFMVGTPCMGACNRQTTCVLFDWS